MMNLSDSDAYPIFRLFFVMRRMICGLGRSFFTPDKWHWDEVVIMIREKKHFRGSTHR